MLNFAPHSRFPQLLAFVHQHLAKVVSGWKSPRRFAVRLARPSLREDRCGQFSDHALLTTQAVDRKTPLGL